MTPGIRPYAVCHPPRFNPLPTALRPSDATDGPDRAQLDLLCPLQGQHGQRCRGAPSSGTTNRLCQSISQSLFTLYPGKCLQPSSDAFGRLPPSPLRATGWSTPVAGDETAATPRTDDAAATASVHVYRHASSAAALFWRCTAARWRSRRRAALRPSAPRAASRAGQR